MREKKTVMKQYSIRLYAEDPKDQETYILMSEMSKEMPATDIIKDAIAHYYYNGYQKNESENADQVKEAVISQITRQQEELMDSMQELLKKQMAKQKEEILIALRQTVEETIMETVSTSNVVEFKPKKNEAVMDTIKDDGKELDDTILDGILF